MIGCAYVVCTDCRMQSDDGGSDRVAAAWNTRPALENDPLADARVTALVDALRITRDRLNSANHDVFDGVWTERDLANETREADAALAAFYKGGKCE